MKPYALLLALLSLSIAGMSQSLIPWNPEYKLELSDFQSPQTEIDSSLTTYSIYSGANVDFAFQMSTYEFMFTKNFNDKVRCIFNRDAAIITAPDTTIASRLVNFGQYSFDMAELYARRFRKEIHEQKGAFSSASFFQPIYNRLHAEMNAKSAQVLKMTNLGRDAELLRQEHQKVLIQIDSLSDYCKSCKPPKKRKKK